jgi:hypothetical protein
MTALVPVRPTFELMNVVDYIRHEHADNPELTLAELAHKVSELPNVEVDFSLQRRDALIHHAEERHYFLRLTYFALLLHQGDTSRWWPVTWWGFNPWLPLRRELRLVAA